jgi:hypothetical protein
MTSELTTYPGYRFPAEIISHAVWLYHVFSLSLREVELILAERGICVTHESIRRWVLRFGADFAGKLRRRRPRLGDTWHLDEVFLRINGELRYLWSELVGIDREHLRFTAEGMTLFIPRSKRDQEGEGATIGIPRGLNLLSCPVRAMEAWLRRTRIERGPVFRRISPGGALEDRLSPHGCGRSCGAGPRWPASPWTRQNASRRMGCGRASSPRPTSKERWTSR